ncbi:formate dehydrogenase subunit gamma [Acidobacteriota bacterium]
MDKKEKDKKLQNNIEEIINSRVEEIMSDPAIAPLGLSQAEIRHQVREKLIEGLIKGLSVETKEIKKSLQKDLAPIRKKDEVAEPEEMVVRFGMQFIIQHFIMLASVIILILTGLPLKFPHFLGGIISVMGGIEMSRILHRVGASGLIIVSAYHTFLTIFHKQGRREFWLLLPQKKDALDFIQMIKFFLGKAEEKPKFGRFNYIEKFDYWAVYWGCVILIGSGLLLWFENISMRFLPKFILDIATEAHSDEALLATLAIIVWHFYNVHFNPAKFPGSMTWWTGKISKHEMQEEHYLEYQEIFVDKNSQQEEKLNKENEKPD